MKLYCRDGRVVATHNDDQDVPSSAYGEGVTIIPFGGALSDLERFGDPPPGWTEEQEDLRPSAAPVLDLAAVKTIAIAAVTAYAEGCGAALTAGYSPAEMQAWPIKEAAARAHKAGTAQPYDTAMLEAETRRTGETVEALADRVIAKAGRFRLALGEIAGLRRATAQAIAAAASEDDIKAVEASAKAKADAALRAIMAGGT